jgi:hypothetical protein
MLRIIDLHSMLDKLGADMDEKTYKAWWQLHLRVARGETLKPDEKIQYDAGLSALNEEEKEQFRPEKLMALRQLRMQVEQLKATHAQLKDESSLLDNKIANLEKAYQAKTGYSLVVEPYGAS